MASTRARGWTADWVVSYLASIGVTRLVEGAVLAWTPDSVPAAVLTVPERPSVEAAVAAAIPSATELATLTIAREHEASVELPRTVTVAAFQDRARLARLTADGTLEATITDLSAKPGEEIDHGPFDPAVPKGLTLHQRLMTIRSSLPDEVPEKLVADSLAGCARRVGGNGLGFDVRRIDASIQAKTDKWIDPIAEMLAFFGILMFPVRGWGRHSRQRGWTGGALGRGSFSWPAWSPALDWWAIDALLDVFYDARRHFGGRADAERRSLGRSGIHGAFQSVSYQPRGGADATRGIGSERLW